MSKTQHKIDDFPQFADQQQWSKVKTIQYQNKSLKISFQNNQLKYKKLISSYSQDYFKQLAQKNTFSLLNHFFITDCSLANVPFLNAPLLQSIALDYVNLEKWLDSEIPSFLEGVYPSLKQIYMIQCCVRKLPKLNCPKLEQIKIIVHRMIISLDQFSESQYPSLIRLNLNNNSIKSIPKLNCPQLQQFSINSNGTVSISEFIKQGDYPFLRKFSAEYNKIVQMPCFSKASSIQQLRLNSNKIQSIKQFNSGQYSCLTILLLSQNQLSNFLKLSAQKLKELTLYSNRINNIELSENYQNLQTIDFHSNSCRQITLFNMKSLKYLNASQNELEQININRNSYKQGQYQEVELQQMQSKSKSKYTSPDPYTEISSLQTVRLNNNNFNKIPEFLTIFNISSLKSLNLKENKITSIEPLSLVNLQFIQYLDLSQNLIVTIFQFKKLKMPNVVQICLHKNLINQCNSMYRCQIIGSKSIKMKNYQLKMNKQYIINDQKDRQNYKGQNKNQNQNQGKQQQLSNQHSQQKQELQEQQLQKQKLQKWQLQEQQLQKYEILESYVQNSQNLAIKLQGGGDYNVYQYTWKEVYGSVDWIFKLQSQYNSLKFTLYKDFKQRISARKRQKIFQKWNYQTHIYYSYC